MVYILPFTVRSIDFNTLRNRKLYMKFKAFLVKPCSSNLAINRSWFKQANALERSTRIAPVLISRKRNRACCVLCPSLKPQVRGFRKVLAYICFPLVS